MPYNFTFDLSAVPCYFYNEIITASQPGKQKKNHPKSQDLILRYRIQEATGLNLSDAAVLLEDLISVQKINNLERGKFLQTEKRALFLPHCSRKYMDNRCKAIFDEDVPSYKCMHCSPDCLVNRAGHFAKEKGYDVYVLPGGSCIPKILKANRYEGIVGVACGEEIKIIPLILKSLGVSGQAVPLIRNGCAKTIFNIETLINIL
jgi:uncharacterized protein